MGAFNSFKTPAGEVTNGEKLMRLDFYGNDHEIALIKINSRIHLATKRVVFNNSTTVGVDTVFKIRSYTDALAILSTTPAGATDKRIADSIIAVLDATAVNGNFPLRDLSYADAGVTSTELTAKIGLFTDANGIVSGSAIVAKSETDKLIDAIYRKETTASATAFTWKGFFASPITWVSTALGFGVVYFILNPIKKRK